MQPFTPALEDLLEHLEDLDRRLRPRKAGVGAVSAGDLLLQKSDLAEIYGLVDTLVAGIRSTDAAYRRYRDRFVRSPAGCLCTGADGVILEANRAAGTLFGRAPDLMQGAPLDTYLLPECAPAFRSAIAALGRGEEVPVQEFSLARADGIPVPAAVAVSASYDPGSGVPEFLWVFFDISGQKKVEEACRESEERYRELTENVSDAFLALDRDGRVISWNRAAARLSGRTVEEAVGQSIYDLFPELRTEDVTGFLGEVMEAGRAGVSEYRLPLRGMEHTFEVRAIPTCEGVSIYLRDISDRRRAEQALRRSEEEYRAVVESQTELIYRWLPDGIITFANDAYCRFIGIPCGNLLGRRYAPTVPAEDQARIRQTHASLTPHHPATTVEHRVVMPDGRVRWQQWTDTAFFDEEGSIVEYQSVGRDITDARMAGEALLLANRKLNLLSDVTRHDILNRLNVLSGYLSLIRERTDDPELQGYYRKEEEAIQGIQRYMAFTRDYRDIGAAAPIWQNVSRIAREAMTGLDMDEVAVEMQTGDLDVYADPLIIRVFANLIEHSARYGETVTTITFSLRREGDTYVILCEDDGVGVSPDEKEKIFSYAHGMNTGLGLFLAREILAITGIVIRETGEPGRGARFELLCPAEVTRAGGQHTG